MTDMATRASSTIGERVPNVEWEEKTSGAVLYAGDVKLPGMLFASICRSPHPHARILSVNADRVIRSPGVVATLTAADLPDRKYIHHGGPMSDRTVLARGVVRYIGEEVAAVAAESPQMASLAAARFDVRYRRLPASTSIEQARRPRASQIHEHAPGNIALSIDHSFGDDSTRGLSDVSISGLYRYPRQNQACMETNSIVASWDAAAGCLELWVSSQAPYFVIKELAHVLDLRNDQIVVHEVAVGGGFGSKSKISEYEAIAAALSIKARRPVSLVLTRQEEFSATKSRHYFEVNLQTTAKSDGFLQSRRAVVNVDNGAYNHSGPSVMGAGTGAIASLYRTSYVDFRANLIYTNTHPSGQFRGYGNPQVTFAIESQMDEVALELGMDPIEFRIMNANQEGDVTHAGYKLESAGLVACLEAARDAIGWHEKRQLGGSGRGVGIAAAIQVSGAYVYPSANQSCARVDVEHDGTVVVRFAGADAGTGQRTILAQIAAAELALPLTSIRVVMMESEGAPKDLGAWSSRGTFMGGHAVRRAAQEAAAELRRRTAMLSGTEPAGTRLDGGRAYAGELSWGVGDVAKATEDACGPLTVVGEYTANIEEPDFATGKANISGAYSFAAHAVEVDVDEQTGKIRILDYVAAHDSGTILNPLLAESQVTGGVAMGIGAALGEELIYSNGKMVNPAYSQYPLPRAADLPRIRPVFISTKDPNGPYGAKGLGEIAIVPVSAAVANAVAHAIGVRIRDIPLTPDKVLTGMRPGIRTRRYHIWRRPRRWESALIRRSYPLGTEVILEWIGARVTGTPATTTSCDLYAPRDVQDAVSALRREGAQPIAGGTDLLAAGAQGLKQLGFLVDIACLEELANIEVHRDGSVRLGAAVRLADLELLEPNSGPLGVMAQAARTIASPQIRQMATVAGNLCQGNRCWFYRSGFMCYKRGGATCPCYAVNGDHRFYHAVLPAGRCQAVTPSDLATVLAALDAEIEVAADNARRRVRAIDFYRGPGETVLRDGEMVTAVTIPIAADRRSSAFEKLNMWTGDFSIVSVCSSLEVAEGEIIHARVVAGGLANRPVRLRRVESALVNSCVPDAAALHEIATNWISQAHPLTGNAWKLDAAAGLIRRALERSLAARREPLSTGRAAAPDLTGEG